VTRNVEQPMAQRAAASAPFGRTPHPADNLMNVAGSQFVQL
jgi:hypothetical protein